MIRLSVAAGMLVVLGCDRRHDVDAAPRVPPGEFVAEVAELTEEQAAIAVNVLRLLVANDQDAAARELRSYRARHPDERYEYLLSVGMNGLVAGKTRASFAWTLTVLDLIVSDAEYESVEEAYALEIIGEAAMHLGEFDTAHSALTRSIELYREAPEHHALDMARVTTRFADLLKKRGRLAEATSFAELALSDRRRQGANLFEVAGSCLQVGELCLARGDAEGALLYFDEADALFARREPIATQLTAKTLQFKGMAHHRLGNLHKARTLLQDASNRFEQEGAVNQRASAEAFLADVELDLDNSASALPRLRGVLSVVSPTLSPDHPQRIRLATLLGEALRRERHVEEAISELKRALASPVASGSGLANSMVRAAQGRVVSSRELVAELSACYVDQGRPDLALAAVEQLRTRTLAEHRHIPNLREIRSSLRDNEAFASMQISRTVVTLLLVAKDPEHDRSIVLAKDRTEAAEFMRQMRELARRTRNPRVEFAVPEKLGRLFGSQTLLSALSATKRVIVATDSPATLVPLETLFPVEQVTYIPSTTMLQELREHRSEPASESPASMMLVCGPDLSGWRQVAEYPDLPLEFAELLRVDTPEKLSTLRHAVTGCGDMMRIAKSAGIAVKPLFKADATLSNVETFAANATYLHFATHGMDGMRGYERLARLYLSPEPNTEPSEQRILTLGRILDDWNNRLASSRLTVLSACETDSSLQVGVMPFALSYGFLQAGCPTVIATRWPVNDEAASMLMTRFYKNLFGTRLTRRNGEPAHPMSPADALADARNWLSRQSSEQNDSKLPRGKNESNRGKTAAHKTSNFKHPYYWSAFVLVGLPD